MHDEVKDAKVFSEFILECVDHSFLRCGDVLVLDNAAIHNYQEASKLESYLWKFHRILLHFLPTHSPG